MPLERSQQEKLDQLLLQAARYQRVSRIGELIAQGANPGAKNRSGHPLLLAAARLENPVVFQALAAAGAPLDFNQDKDNMGMQPIHIAAVNGSLGVLKLVLSRGISPSSSNHLGHTAAHLAAGHGQREALMLLIANGANLNARDGAGATPLYIAAYRKELATFALLLEHGADPALCTNEGVSPIECCRSSPDFRDQALALLAGSEARRAIKDISAELSP